MLACCAFAVFLLQQLLMPIAILRERLFGKKAPRANTAVLWTPESAVAAPPWARTALRPTVVLVIVLEIFAVGGSVAAATLTTQSGRQSAEQKLLTALHTSICHALGRPLS